MAIATTSARSAATRAGTLGEDVLALELRASSLTAEVVMLTAKRDHSYGYCAAAPLVGDRRFAECAGVATGSAVARARDAGRADLAAAVTLVAESVGSTELIAALLDAAGAAIAWATLISVSDDEQSAQMPVRSGRADRIQRLSGVTGGHPATPRAILAMRAGRLSAREVFAGTVSADVRRELSTCTVMEVVVADARFSGVLLGELPVGEDRRVGSLSADERHDLVTAVVQAWDERRSWVGA